MDSTLDARQVAERLGVPLTRVLEACRSGRISGCRRQGRRWQLERSALVALERQWGAVPQPRPEGLSRNDVLVLAALVRHARGLPSARAAAASSGVAPTTAGASLDRLRQQGLAEQVSEHRFARGRSRLMTIWYARLLDERVTGLLGYLNRVVLPAEPGVASCPDRLPDHVWHIAWNADPLEVSPRQHATYLAHRVLTTADPETTAWAARTLPAEAWRQAARMRGVTARDRAWAQAVADECEHVPA